MKSLASGGVHENAGIRSSYEELAFDDMCNVPDGRSQPLRDPAGPSDVADDAADGHQEDEEWLRVADDLSSHEQ